MKPRYILLLFIALLFQSIGAIAQDGNFDKLKFNEITKGLGAADYSGWGLNLDPLVDIRPNPSPTGRNSFVINNHDGLTFSAHSNYGGIRFYNQGYPIGPLEPSAGAKMVMSITSGNVGIKTTTPRAALDLGEYLSNDQLSAVLGRLQEGDNTNTGTFLGVKGFRTDIIGGKSFSISHNFYGETNSSINFHRGQSITGGFISFNTDSDIERLRIAENGNVLIGKTSQTNPAYKLDINGKARANEIVVNTTGADFVFENNYKLRPLTEVETFVTQNKHLPEIPTAKTMQEEGVGISELQTKLLQKVEELTLYIIQQQKEIDELKKKLNK